MKFLYQIGIWTYGVLLAVASWFHPKAKRWIAGRKIWRQNLSKALLKDRPRIWFHCASLGEFEQARNLIEGIREEFPAYQLVLSFFSPSGYEVRKNYPQVDYVCYLPLDTPSNARDWVRMLQPEIAFVVKYELWLNLFEELHSQKIPLLLVSARIRIVSTSWMHSLRKLLHHRAFEACRHIFAQDEASAQAIRQISPKSEVSVSFDTRYDRVYSTWLQHEGIEEIASFKAGRFCIVCGSTWVKDEQILFALYDRLKDQHNVCLIIAPHEIDQKRISKWMQKAPAESIRFSQLSKMRAEHRILWIDNIGMLSKLYAYANIAYLGGAWGKKVHNILEAVVFGCPVVFGPNYTNLPEAPELVRLGGACSVQNADELEAYMEKMLRSLEERERVRQVNSSFVQERIGATKYILNWCKTAGYLTRTEPT